VSTWSRIAEAFLGLSEDPRPQMRPPASPPKAPASTQGGDRKRLRPELEKVIQKYAIQLAPEDDPTWSTHEASDLLRRFAHEMEAAEGEDPSELDPGGPAPGSTGMKKR